MAHSRLFVGVPHPSYSLLRYLANIHFGITSFDGIPLAHLAGWPCTVEVCMQCPVCMCIPQALALLIVLYHSSAIYLVQAAIAYNTH